jgi:hypothetical protein
MNRASIRFKDSRYVILQAALRFDCRLLALPWSLTRRGYLFSATSEAYQTPQQVRFLPSLLEFCLGLVPFNRRFLFLGFGSPQKAFQVTEFVIHCIYTYNSS